MDVLVVGRVVVVMVIMVEVVFSGGRCCGGFVVVISEAGELWAGRGGVGDGCCGYSGDAIVVVVVKLRCVGGVVESVDVTGLVVLAAVLVMVVVMIESMPQECVQITVLKGLKTSWAQDSIRTSVVNKYHEKKKPRTLAVMFFNKPEPFRVLTRHMLTLHNARRTKDDRKSSS
ncbi:hypothetical protein DPMN_025296 [Dreissena polymorpha]|uniref:Uncharacterized protein n=1 Tax=Dreissena polymorpha TaxID=45954 RepID=A0A9D4LQJ6_DREPO|nr:hypothetical protein DPMN_025296 [Dreissena polymorpha]